MNTTAFLISNIPTGYFFAITPIAQNWSSITSFSNTMTPCGLDLYSEFQGATAPESDQTLSVRTSLEKLLDSLIYGLNLVQRKLEFVYNLSEQTMLFKVA